MEQRNMKQQRKKYAITSALLSLVLILTGTFAWTSMSQRALNEVTIPENPGGRIHDDFNSVVVMNGGTTANKDIYAENFGSEDLLVRIKLSEFLSIAGTELIADTVYDEKDTWVTYDSSSAIRTYVNWTMGGDKIFLPTFNLATDPSTDPLALATDASGDAIDDTAVSLGLSGQTAVPGNDGSHNYFTTVGVPYDNTGAIVAAGTAGAHETKSTIPSSGSSTVISMAEWISGGQVIGNFWVLDEEDGWAYWANKLAQGEATSLLLDQLTFTGSAGGEIYYAIDVIGEFATVADVGKFYDGISSLHGDASTDAQYLLNAIVNPITIPDILGTTFIDHETGTVWRLLAFDSNDNALIITQYVYNFGQAYNASGNWTLYESSDLKNTATTGMDAWYSDPDNVGSTLRGQALDYAYQNASGVILTGKGVTGYGVERDSATSGTWDVTANVRKARTVAGAIGTKGSGSVFPLSISEVNQYTSALNRIATTPTGTAYNWLLRSPGSSASVASSHVIMTDGSVNPNVASSTSRTFRAALWINP